MSLPHFQKIDSYDYHLQLFTIVIFFLIIFVSIGFVVRYAFAEYKKKRNKKLSFLSFWNPPEDQTKAALQGKTLHREDVEKQTIDYQDLCRQHMRQHDSKETASAPIKLNEKFSDKGPTTIACKNDSNNTPAGSGELKLTRTTSVQEEEPLVSAALNMDISTGHMILQYMEQHLSGERLQAEWTALESTSVSCEYSQAAALLPVNQNKNLHPNDKRTLPFDHSRVLLNDLHNEHGSDYINASLLIDADPSRAAYVAAQNPLQNTIGDFWQMVWEQDCRVLVLLSGGKSEPNLVRYWPSQGAQRFGALELRLVSEHYWTDAYMVRSFYLKHMPSGDTRTLTQLHLLCWPENVLPPSIDALLAFRRKVNKCYRGKSSPILVHCSDGVGRTGCYCLLDMVLNRLAKGAKEIDVAATLEHLRDQRPSMVLNRDQFEFCLRAIAQEVHNMLRCLQGSK